MVLIWFDLIFGFKCILQVGINHFADMTEQEFRTLVMPHPKPAPNNGATYVHPPPASTEDLPPYVNWRLKNAVTQVKDQGTCGSCWTFGTTGSLEGAWSIKYGQLISLSEQQIVDCSWVCCFYLSLAFCFVLFLFCCLLIGCGAGLWCSRMRWWLCCQCVWVSYW